MIPLPAGGPYPVRSEQAPVPEVDEDGEVKAGWVSVLQMVAGYYGVEALLTDALKDIPVLSAGQFAELWIRLHQPVLEEAECHGEEGTP